jgi:hypothetical protein
MSSPQQDIGVALHQIPGTKKGNQQLIKNIDQIAALPMGVSVSNYLA